MHLGIVAGGGVFPIMAAKRAKEKGHVVVSAALKEVTSPEIEKLSDRCLWIKMGELSRLIRFFKQEGVQGVLLAGKVAHAQALQPMDAIKLLADPRMIGLLLKLKDKKANPLLKAIVDEFEKEGMKVLPSFCFLESELLKPGLHSKRKLTDREREDVAFGYQMAKKIAAMDIGLTICVSQETVLAVEALEGTDQCIRRAGEILKNRGRQNAAAFSVVKVARPGQDPRYDLPVIGPATLESMRAAGAKVLAAQPGWTLILEREETLRLADTHKMSLVGYQLEQI